MDFFDSRDARPHLDIKVVDDLQIDDPDEKPTSRLAVRIRGVERRRRIAGLIGAFQVVTHIGGEVVAVDARTRRAVRVLWSSRRVLVIRGTLSDASAAELSDRLRASDVIQVPKGSDLLAVLAARFAPPEPPDQSTQPS